MKSYLNALRKSVFLTTVTEEQINEVTVPEDIASKAARAIEAMLAVK